LTYKIFAGVEADDIDAKCVGNGLDNG